MEQLNKMDRAGAGKPDLSPAKKWINRIIGAAGFLFLLFLIYKMVMNKLG